jgi:hypothetical protein
MDCARIKRPRQILVLFYGRYVAVIFQIGHLLKLIMAMCLTCNLLGPLCQPIAPFWFFREPDLAVNANIQHYFFMQDFQG